MFRIEMLPAAHGDCLWLEYGNGREIHRILIDGGPAHAYPALRERILHLPADERHFDLLVITHIDADHIEGIIRLLLDAEALDCRFERIWFNGRDQINAVPDPAGEPLGGVQGEILGMLIADYEQRTATKVWNLGFDQALAAIDRSKPALPAVELPGACRLTMLSPDHERLLDLKDNWARELKAARVPSGDVAKLRERLAEGRYRLWEDPAIVSFLGATLVDGGYARIGPVYTPPASRGRGYATALVAVASLELLERGAQDVFLSTDVANPVSNAIYARVGYRPVDETVGYDFVAP